MNYSKETADLYSIWIKVKKDGWDNFEIDGDALCEFAEWYAENRDKNTVDLGAVMCCAGDFVKEAGGDWIKVLRVEGRNIFLDYNDGLNCLDVDDVIAWKHGT